MTCCYIRIDGATCGREEYRQGLCSNHAALVDSEVAHGLFRLYDELLRRYAPFSEWLVSHGQVTA